MALRALMLKKRLDDKRKALEDLKTVDFAQREAELEKAIEETTTDDERSFVDSEIEKFEAEKTAHDASVRELETEIENLEKGYPFMSERDIYAKQDVMELALDAGDVCTVQAFNQAQEDLLVRLIREEKIGFLKD